MSLVDSLSEQTAHGKCAKVNGHCHSDHLSSLIKEEFRKEKAVHSWPGKLTGGEGDELHLLSSVLGRPFTGKSHSCYSSWDQWCRQLRLGLLKTKESFTRACLCCGVNENCSAESLKNVEAFLASSL